MKIRNGFVVREIAGENVVIALGEASKYFHGMLKLNETGRMIWDCLEQGMEKDAIIDSIMDEYEDKPERQIVAADYDRFIETLRGAEILE